MKIAGSIFGKERKELEKFNQLDLDERSIVFYSESSIILYPYVEEIIKELEKRNQKICYVTSSKNDPIFKMESENIKVFYIGDGSVKYKFFWELKAKTLIMTMADLENYWIKRSITFPVHYIYVFHSINSPLMGYNSGKISKGAFDHFDSIFCVGPHQIQEFHAIEKLYNLKQKNLVEYGHSLFDKLIKLRSSSTRQNFMSKNNKKKILIAPSWGKQNLLEYVGIKLIKILLDAGYHVTVRPHPMIIKKSSKLINQIKEKFEKNPDFLLDTNTSSFEQLFSESDGPFYDPKGGLLSNTWSEFYNIDSLNKERFGLYVEEIWIGDTSNNCSNWNSDSSMLVGIYINLGVSKPISSKENGACTGYKTILCACK